MRCYTFWAAGRAKGAKSAASEAREQNFPHTYPPVKNFPQQPRGRRSPAAATVATGAVGGPAAPSSTAGGPTSSAAATWPRCFFSCRSPSPVNPLLQRRRVPSPPQICPSRRYFTPLCSTLGVEHLLLFLCLAPVPHARAAPPTHGSGSSSVVRAPP
jgi:hypothetical protein